MNRTVRKNTVLVFQTSGEPENVAVRLCDDTDWPALTAQFRNWLTYRAEAHDDAKTCLVRLQHPENDEDDLIDLRLDLNRLFVAFMMESQVAEGVGDCVPYRADAVVGESGLHGFAMSDLWRS